ncbi:WGR domain-containing protein [Yoonia sp.]|nr:WGR domain-containing protein [Yoonia sp.]
MQLDVFPDQIRLRREEPSKNVRRFYMMVVQPDLFGGASLIREWGRLGSAGQVRIDHHADEGQAINALSNLMASKRKRGYHSDHAPVAQRLELAAHNG